MSDPIQLQVELPEELFDSIQSFLQRHPIWNQERMMCAALSLFLLQNGFNNRHTSRFYLDSLFQGSVNQASADKASAD